MISSVQENEYHNLFDVILMDSICLIFVPVLSSIADDILAIIVNISFVFKIT